MKISLLIAILLLSSCHIREKLKDVINYKSVTGRTGTVKTTIAGQLIEYKNARVKYSETNSSTILITTESGVDVYIQGPMIIELNK